MPRAHVGLTTVLSAFGVDLSDDLVSYFPAVAVDPNV